MVTIDLDISAVVGLGENGKISKEDFEKYLSKYEKDEIINYLVKDIYGDSEDINDDLDDEDY